ncbi:hypothetical protein CHS0354_031669 [Potamilus streckersoni]|uniref:ADP-ribosyl cyclase/cyclic ADP-ribose hydrolase n=1 Tax=Potamilus streckersoni TaxID=2493646 RepID=A0AAE0SS79_9BIVA|nr:hypothetical protein CHS0354_031669 [Potamilus streckersoni]
MWFTKCFQLFLITNVIAAAPCFQGNHATAELRSRVIGRCLEFQANMMFNVSCEEKTRNCTDVWEKFSSGFAFKDPCNVKNDTFREYIMATNHYVPKDKAMFWGGVYNLAHRYSNRGQSKVTLEDTMPGYVADGLSFCGDNSTSDGIARENITCPSTFLSANCSSTVSSVFWTSASINFAKSVTGEIFVMLNASRNPIYRNNSYFRMYEVPNLTKGTVTKATVYIVGESPISKGNLCGSESILELKANLAEKDIAFECQENPRDVMNILCGDNPRADVCSSIWKTSRSSRSKMNYHALLYIAFSVFTFSTWF